MEFFRYVLDIIVGCNFSPSRLAHTLLFVYVVMSSAREVFISWAKTNRESKCGIFNREESVKKYSRRSGEGEREEIFLAKSLPIFRRMRGKEDSF